MSAKTGMEGLLEKLRDRRDRRPGFIVLCFLSDRRCVVWQSRIWKSEEEAEQQLHLAREQLDPANFNGVIVPVEVKT